MRRLWERIVAIYGHKWASAYGDAAEDDAGKPTLSADTWRAGLAGIAERQIGTGLQACIVSADPWPPTLPEFRALCLGVPPFAQVRAAFADRGAAKTGFMRAVSSGIDWHRFRMADADRADRMLRDAYECAREYVMRGGVLPPDPVAEIEAPKPEPRTPASPETVARAMTEAHRAVYGEREAEEDTP